MFILAEKKCLEATKRNFVMDEKKLKLHKKKKPTTMLGFWIVS